jgi:hypothetical protein
MSIDASQCVVIMERIAQAIREEDQKEVDKLIIELKNMLIISNTYNTHGATMQLVLILQKPIIQSILFCKFRLMII